MRALLCGLLVARASARNPCSDFGTVGQYGFQFTEKLSELPQLFCGHLAEYRLDLADVLGHQSSDEALAFRRQADPDHAAVDGVRLAQYEAFAFQTIDNTREIAGRNQQLAA